jgi:uncharacterized protein
VSHSPGAARPRAAVVGAGVAGLTAAYLLQRACDVTLYEADGRLGGHAHTHDMATGDGRLVSLDTGFIVHNSRAYPHLLRLFGELGVATRDTEMSMSVRCQGCGMEYAGARGPRGLFPVTGSLARPEYLAMLAAIPVFYARPRRLLAAPGHDALTLGEFLARGRYRPYFVRHFALPLVSAVWSCPPADALAYPARYLFEFLAHHGMLSLARSAGWRTVVGGSRAYVERIAKQLTSVRTGAPVRAIRRVPGGVDIHAGEDRAERFSRVVVATHPDQALRLLDPPTRAEQEVLGAFRYTSSQVLLHTETALLPSAPAARASWNYLLPGCQGPAGQQVTVSYHLNRLTGLAEPAGYVVTLNAAGRVAPDRVLAHDLPPSALHRRLGGRPAPARGHEHAGDRLRRRLSRLGVPRGRLPFRRAGRPVPGGRW